MTKYRAGDRDAAFAEAERLLLVYLPLSAAGFHLAFDLQDSDVPLLLAVRCHMVLSTNDDHPDYVGHARRAVRLLNEDARDMVDPAMFPQVQFDEARRLLGQAEAQYAADMATYQEDGEDDDAVETEEPVEAASVSTAAVPAVEETKKASRRIDSRYADQNA